MENNILRFWLQNMQDEEQGGFYGRIDGGGALHKDAPKGAILNARILWSFSAAYRVLGKDEYLCAARRAKDYILEHFLDKEYGGVYWSVDCKGLPLDTKKQFYAIGFAIYGLSEYVRATGDKQALDCAIDLYHTLEEHALDPVNGGYIEALSRSWGELGDVRLSDLDQNYPKSQNTHLHIIEPYTNLYRVWRSAELEKSLRNIIDIFLEKILNRDTHHLDLFFNMDWTREPIQRESYGHDIECSWLMHEAALTLGDEVVLSRMEKVVKQVAKASEKGLNPDGSMVHEANLTAGTVDDELHWWVQAEAVVGFFNLWQHFGDETALAKSLHCWQYIKQNLVDYAAGEWYWSRYKDGTINHKDDKAGFWKCPYHNSRMCLEILERLGK